MTQPRADRVRSERRLARSTADGYRVQLVEGRSGRVPMRPDFVFRRRGVAAFVGDLEYKLTTDATARNADFYQLLAYTTAMDLPEGVLIYCLEEGGRPARSVTPARCGTLGPSI